LGYWVIGLLISFRVTSCAPPPVRFLS